MPEATPDTKIAKVVAPKKFKLTIHAEPEGGDKGDVVIGHNYSLVQIKRGVAVVVDEGIIDALKATLIETQIQSEDGKMYPVQVPRYNYQIEPA